MRYSSLVLMALLVITFASGLCLAQTPAPDPDLSCVDYSIPDSAIAKYLETNLLPHGYKGEKVISVFKILGESNQEDTTFIYLWTYTQAYYKEKGRLMEGTGVSGPIALTALVEPHGYKILSFKQPASGSAYNQSLQQLFPADILPKLRSGYDMRAASRELAKQYYHLN